MLARAAEVNDLGLWSGSVALGPLYCNALC
jgi:hypothetical protein